MPTPLKEIGAWLRAAEAFAPTGASEDLAGLKDLVYTYPQNPYPNAGKVYAAIVDRKTFDPTLAQKIEAALREIGLQPSSTKKRTLAPSPPLQLEDKAEHKDSPLNRNYPPQLVGRTRGS